MSQTTEGFTADCVAKLGDNPGYKGTVHEDAMARSMGYRAALVPGIMVLGYVADGVMAQWGMDWIRRGRISGRSRRGVYDGDKLRTVFTPDGDGVRFSMFNDEGEEVALGTAGLPTQRPVPPALEDYPRSEFVTPPPLIGPGDLQPGDRFGSLEMTITPEFQEQCLTEFGQTWPELRSQNLFSPACIQKVVSRSINTSYHHVTPPVFVATGCQNFDIVHVGDTLTTYGIVRTIYVRNGHHYYDADILVTKNGDVPVALLQRSMIYSARPK